MLMGWMSLIKKMQERFGILGELLAFLWSQKLWWMIPMILVLVIFALILLFGQSAGIAPFLYPMF